jgi:hypothetical protein
MLPERFGRNTRDSCRDIAIPLIIQSSGKRNMSIKKAIAISFVTVVPLTIASHLTDSIFFFYALYPGAIVSLLITGGHGGTRTEEAIAPIVGSLVNIAILSLLLCGAMRMLRTRAEE